MKTQIIGIQGNYKKIRNSLRSQVPHFHHFQGTPSILQIQHFRQDKQTQHPMSKVVLSKVELLLLFLLIVK